MTPVLQLKNIRKSCGGVTAIEGFSLDLHLPGTDHLGRDMLSRVIFGARVSMAS